MTARLIALYGRPTDTAAFDRHYRETHIPLAKKLPGLRSYTVSDGQVGAPDGKAPYYLIAELTFDSLSDIQAALGSAEGAAAAGDLSTFASGGATLLWYEVRDA
ncbi:MAG: EthD family reductase [Chloroflexota bacterium]|nr:EthD family reductase [Chloroflexota bacterium]